MEINDIIKLMQAVKDYGLTEFKIEEDSCKLSIKREKEVRFVSEAVLGAVTQYMSDDVPADVAVNQMENVPKHEEPEGIGSDKVIASPLVGTFYHSATPEAEPFVKAGDTVKKGQTLGIIEAMKLMNEIESEYDGIVEAVLVGNEDVVEYGQPLFRIR